MRRRRRGEGQADAEAKQRTSLAIHDAAAAARAAEATTQERDANLSELSTTSAHNVQAQLDEATAINQQLRGELQRLGKDVDKILAERGTLAKALDDAKARLDELRKAQAAAESRTQLFRDLGRRFKSSPTPGRSASSARRAARDEGEGRPLFEAATPECGRRARGR